MILYKYYDTEGALKTLGHMKWKLTLPNDANDPFEFLVKIPANFPDGVQFAKSYQDQASKDFGFISLSKTSPKHKESILMWSHYTESHKGCVMEFDLDISGMYRSTAHVLHKPIEVIYSDERVKGEVGEKEYIDLLSTKAKCWEYEQEVRVRTQVMTDVKFNDEILTCINSIKKDAKIEKLEQDILAQINEQIAFKNATLVEGLNIYTSTFPKKALISITFGVNSKIEFIDQIKEYLKKYGLNPKLYKSRLHPSLYGFDEPEEISL